MAVTAFWYGSAIGAAFNKEIDWVSDDIRVALVTSAYTPLQDTHDYWDDVVANEASGTGYTANGQALVSPTSAYTAGSNTWKLDADDAVWAGSTVTARYAVIYDRTPGTDGTRPLIGYTDFGQDVSTTAGTFTIAWAAAGILTLVVD